MKGMLQSLEAVIGILMVLTVYVTFFAPKEQLPEFETINWRSRAFDALSVLDENNELRLYALANDTTTIENKLLALLPVERSCLVVVCNETCPTPNITANKITSVAYFIAGRIGNIQPKQIILYVW